MSVRILLADDHGLVRQGLRRILESRPEFVVVAEAATGAEAVELAKRENPELAILDVTMKGLNGLEALRQIRRQAPEVKVLMLSMHADERYVVRALRQGARGYVLKDCVEDELIGALVTVLGGGVFLSADVRGYLARREQEALAAPDLPDDRYELLTERERHVYQLLAEGNSNKEIASSLGLSLHTVETHRARIMEKLGLHTAAELVLSAVRRGLVR
jgi:DNA-binding NarL/FixJ family response regulator